MADSATLSEERGGVNIDRTGGLRCKKPGWRLVDLPVYVVGRFCAGIVASLEVGRQGIEP